MTLEHLKNYIKAQLGAEPAGEAERDASAAGTAGSEPLHIAVGAIDANRERCIGVYPGKPPARQRVCLGGSEATLTGELYATVLVHWGKNMREAMEKAAEVYGLFYAWGGGAMNGVRVYAVEPGGGPVPVGRNEHGVCEFVINLKIIFEKECVQ